MNRSLKRICLYLPICAAAGVISQAQTFTTLANFRGSTGGYPFSGPLVQASNGKIYGTAEIGGANNDGTVFEISPAATLTMCIISTRPTESVRSLE
jgi:uncharacterized repeat protein (TIGR03803 family)